MPGKHKALAQTPPEQTRLEQTRLEQNLAQPNFGMISRCARRCVDVVALSWAGRLIFSADGLSRQVRWPGPDVLEARKTVPRSRAVLKFSDETVLRSPPERPAGRNNAAAGPGQAEFRRLFLPPGRAAAEKSGTGSLGATTSVGGIVVQGVRLSVA
jgi:hypothetical protein